MEVTIMHGELDIYSNGLPMTYDGSCVFQVSHIVETIDLAFSRQQKKNFHKYPTPDYFYKNILMRKVRRIRDLLGLAETDSIDTVLKKVVLEKYTDGKMIEEEKKMKYLIEWKALEPLYATERTENIPRRNFLLDIAYFIEHCSDSTRAISIGLKAINQLGLCGNLTISENCDCCIYFFDQLLKTLKENNPNFTSQVVDILKMFCTSPIVKIMLILNLDIDMYVFMRITQIERFNFASLWHEERDSAFPLNCTLLFGNLENFNKLLICGSPNTYDNDLVDGFYTYIKERLKDYEGENLAEDWEEDRENLNQNISFLALQVLCLYLKIGYEVEKIESLILLWKSIPDPFLTYEAIILESSCRQLCELYDDCWFWYLTHLSSEGAHEMKFSSPRSLLHLAQCSVRKSLAGNFVVPSDVSFNMKHLELPKELQEKVKLGVDVSLPNVIL